MADEFKCLVHSPLADQVPTYEEYPYWWSMKINVYNKSAV
jgi:hypothetical protein